MTGTPKHKCDDSRLFSIAVYFVCSRSLVDLWTFSTLFCRRRCRVLCCVCWRVSCARVHLSCFHWRPMQCRVVLRHVVLWIFRIIFRLFTACLGHQVDSGGSSFGTKGPTHPTFKRRVRTRVTKLQMMLARFPGPLAQFEELTCKPK